MGDPLKGFQINIGGKDRTILFSYRAMRVASATFRARGGTGDLDAAVRGLLFDAASTFELAAAGLIADADRPTSDTIEAWCEAEPEVYPQLVVAVTNALTEAYARMIKPEVKPSGEAPPSTTPTP
jgi:hypothetical protein